MTKILDAVLKGSPPVLKGYSIFTDAFQQLIKQRNALIKDDWNKLELLANQGLGMAYGSYRELNRNIGILQAQMIKANEELISFLKVNANHKDTRKEFFTEFKKNMLKSNPNLPGDWKKALDAMGEGNTANNIVLESLKKGVPENNNEVDSAIEATVSQATRSLMALTYSGFNSHYKLISAYPFISHQDDLIPDLQNEIDIFKELLESSLKKLHLDILNKISPQSSCDSVLRALEVSLPAFGRLQATIRHYALALKNGQNSVASEKAGKLAAIAGDLTRDAFASYAAAYYLSLQSLKTNIDPKIKKVLEPESGLKFDKNIQNGKSTKISKINTVVNGDFIEINGFVKSISVRRDSDDKLISQVVLEEAAGNVTAEAVGLFVHLRHTGMVEGAYCCLSGVWQSASKLNKNKPAVEIDKLSINELSKNSWKIRFQDLADQFLDHWPGGLHLTYGLSQHVSKSKSGESKILGAGEIIFKPFTD